MDTDDTGAGLTTRHVPVAWVLQDSDGAGVAVCNQRHGQQLWVLRRALDPGVRLVQLDQAPVTVCTHCGWCGDAVVAPMHCAVHAPRACPDFDALATEAAKRCVELITGRLGENDLPDTFWHYLPIVARTARRTGQLNPAVLAEMMWRNRAAWHSGWLPTIEQL